MGDSQTNEARHYIGGTLKAPHYLVRSRWPDGEPPFESYDGAVDDLRKNDGMGSWILKGDTILTRIPADKVDQVKAYLRARDGH
jgi:hypothetical protein